MKQKFAPIFIIVIALVLVMLYAGAVFIVLLNMGPLLTFVGIVFALGGTGVAVALIVTLKRRLKEIEEEKDDDYSKY
jgi:hypothetical protein